MRTVSDRAVEKIKIQVLYSITFFSQKSLRFFEIMWKKYCRARQATDDGMTHEHCMLDN